MKRLLFVLLLILPLIGFGKDKINYFISGNYNDENILYAEIKGELIELEKSLCISIVNLKDFNQNGYLDVLIKETSGCGKIPSKFFIYSFNGEFFKRSQSIGNSWGGIEISKNQEFNFSDSINDYFLFTVNNEEAIDQICKSSTDIFKFVNYDFELVSRFEDNKIESENEITSLHFQTTRNNDESLSLYTDLDDDGLIDKIKTKYWTRWGVISSWEIIFGNGKSYNSKKQTKRIGFLKTKTNNVFDIVVGCNEILKWNGEKYE